MYKPCIQQHLGAVCFGIETVPNLMTQCNLLLTSNRAFPVQPTVNVKYGLPSATYC